MKNKAIVLILIITLVLPLNIINVAGEITAGTIYEGNVNIEYRNVTVYAPAVASTESGYVGVISTITVTIQSQGSGRVFVDTLPLTQVDMQGSARLAVKVASALVQNDRGCEVNPSSYDYFFVVRTSSPIIGGPSAGAVMTVATIALLENWTIDKNTVMTGMINPDGSVGPIGGIIQKLDAAFSVGAKRFLIPKGQGTYTEVVQETVSSNGWVRTISKPVTRNVQDYSDEKGYDIEVVEIAEINQAVENFTGYIFTFEGSENEISTEDYISSMKPLATSLLDEASNNYQQITEKLENADIPNSFPNYYKNSISNDLSVADEYLQESEKWYNEGLYYTSTSKSFQSLIYSRYVNYTCDFFNSEDNEYLEKLINDVQSFYNNASEIAKNAQVEGFITLQSVGAAQRRASEAKITLENVINAYDSVNSYSDVIGLLADLAFVVERCNSITWWIGIGEKFQETITIDNSTLENLALEYIEEAQQSVIYSSVLLEEMGSTYGESASYLSDAEEMLAIARDDLDHNLPAAALFEALDSLVNANVAIELLGTNAEEKLDYSSEAAISNIAKNRKQGIEPVLAVSFYEYAESLRNESNYNAALTYYKYAGMIAGALGFTNLSCTTTNSRYVGIPAFTSRQARIWYKDMLYLTGLFILGILAGIGIGLIVKGIDPKEKRKVKKRVKRRKPQQQIKKWNNQDFPDNQIPRSIRDYYKNDK